MPSFLRQPSDAVCWNCDRDADETISVTLRSPAGVVRGFWLCRACEDDISPALTQVAADAGIAIDYGASRHQLAG